MPATSCSIYGYPDGLGERHRKPHHERHMGNGGQPAAERKIKVTLRDDAAECLLTFDDSGIGLEAGTEHFIFHPAFSTKRNKHGELSAPEWVVHCALFC